MSELQNREVDMEQAQQDYRNEEGLLCCGKCRTRKEIKIPWLTFDENGKRMERVLSCPCRCEQERREKEEAERKEREHQMAICRRQSVCFTSPKRRLHTFENATMIAPDVIDKARAYVEHWSEVKEKNVGLLFWGDCGTGKSYLAACIANALMEQEVPVLMRNMADFLSADWKNREELYQDIARYGLVIFDDFGMERGSDFGVENVCKVIEARCASGKPSIITTNLSLQELKQPPDLGHKRIYDRVIEMCVPVYFGGANARPAIHRNKIEVFKDILNGGN